jgi:hypothetical protein
MDLGYLCQGVPRPQSATDSVAYGSGPLLARGGALLYKDDRRPKVRDRWRG